jgi:hypothetical protein
MKHAPHIWDHLGGGSNSGGYDDSSGPIAGRRWSMILQCHGHHGPPEIFVDAHSLVICFGTLLVDQIPISGSLVRLMSSSEKSPFFFVTSKWDLAGEMLDFYRFLQVDSTSLLLQSLLSQVKFGKFGGWNLQLLGGFFTHVWSDDDPTFFFSGTPTKWYQYFFCLTIWRGSLIL